MNQSEQNTKQYRIAWYYKKDNEIPEPGEINYGSWCQDSEDMVQAWVEDLNKKHPDIYHYIQFKMIDISISALYKWILTKPQDIKFPTICCKECLIAQYLLDNGFTNIEVLSNWWHDLTQPERIRHSFNSDPKENELVIEFIEYFDCWPEESVSKTQAIEMLERFSKNHQLN